MNSKINKKGAMSTLLKIILFLIVLGIMFPTTILPLTKNLQKMNPDQYLDGKDFDSDNNENQYLSDLVDPCPCDHSEVKREVNGFEFCVADNYNQGSCASANKIIYEDAPKDSLKLPGFIWTTNKDGYKECIYTYDACIKLIKAKPDFFKQVALSKITNGLASTKPDSSTKSKDEKKDKKTP